MNGSFTKKRSFCLGLVVVLWGCQKEEPVLPTPPVSITSEHLLMGNPSFAVTAISKPDNDDQAKFGALRVVSLQSVPYGLWHSKQEFRKTTLSLNDHQPNC